jgi:hypothetical protein
VSTNRLNGELVTRVFTGEVPIDKLCRMTYKVNRCLAFVLTVWSGFSILGADLWLRMCDCCPPGRIATAHLTTALRGCRLELVFFTLSPSTRLLPLLT